MDGNSGSPDPDTSLLLLSFLLRPLRAHFFRTQRELCPFILVGIMPLFEVRIVRTIRTDTQNLG